jgi:hypothetical protein
VFFSEISFGNIFVSAMWDGKIPYARVSLGKGTSLTLWLATSLMEIALPLPFQADVPGSCLISEAGSASEVPSGRWGWVAGGDCSGDAF